MLFRSYSEAHKVELAVAIRRAAAEVVVLPETSAEYGQAVADLLAQDGLRYTVFSAGDQKDDADPTTVLVSAVIGDYEQAQARHGQSWAGLQPVFCRRPDAGLSPRERGLRPWACVAPENCHAPRSKSYRCFQKTASLQHQKT